MTTKKFCFIGHVDAGKSTIAGHTYIKCGGLSDHELSELKKGKSKTQMWSRVLDIWTEEQEKGKTHESSSLTLKYNGNTYEMIDTPGHKMFIRSMIEGISQFNANEIVACLIISASKGEFEAGWVKGQTKEDIILVRSIGIRNIIVLINKMDSVNWSREVYDGIVKKINPFINGCKFVSVDYVPVSGYDGIGLTDSDGMPNWYDGKTFMNTLEGVKLEEIDKGVAVEFPEKWVRMVIDVRILKVPANHIITAGYECIMHYENNEYNVCIEKLDKKIFVKENEGCKMIVVSRSPVFKKRGSVNVIFRSFEDTVGFGKIVSIKK